MFGDLLLRGLLLALDGQQLPSASGFYMFWGRRCISQMLLIQTLRKKVLDCFAKRREIVVTRSLVAIRRF